MEAAAMSYRDHPPVPAAQAPPPTAEEEDGEYDGSAPPPTAEEEDGEYDGSAPPPTAEEEGGEDDGYCEWSWRRELWDSGNTATSDAEEVYQEAHKGGYTTSEDSDAVVVVGSWLNRVVDMGGLTDASQCRVVAENGLGVTLIC